MSSFALRWDGQEDPKNVSSQLTDRSSSFQDQRDPGAGSQARPAEEGPTAPQNGFQAAPGHGKDLPRSSQSAHPSGSERFLGLAVLGPAGRNRGLPGIGSTWQALVWLKSKVGHGRIERRFFPILPRSSQPRRDGNELDHKDRETIGKTEVNQSEIQVKEKMLWMRLSKTLLSKFRKHGFWELGNESSTQVLIHRLKKTDPGPGQQIMKLAV